MVRTPLLVIIIPRCNILIRIETTQQFYTLREHKDAIQDQLLCCNFSKVLCLLANFICNTRFVSTCLLSYVTQHGDEA